MSNTLLPINATAQERALEAAAARVSDVPVLARQTWDPDNCPPALLPWLASAFSVDTWDPAWSDDQKRQTIKDSVTVHRQKGTIGSVRRALASLGLSATVQEWFGQAPLGAPFTFQLLVTADQTGFDQVALASIQDIVNSTKNLRSHLSAVVPRAVTVAGPTVAAVTLVGADITINFDEATFALMNEGAKNGEASTEAAVDKLHTLVNVKIAASNYW